jgi:hypothetical protein
LKSLLEIVVPLAGIEPATSGSTIRRSNQLSYNGTSLDRLALSASSICSPFGEGSHTGYRSLIQPHSRGKAKTRKPRRLGAGQRKGRREEVPAFPVTNRREEVPAAARKEAGGGAAFRYSSGRPEGLPVFIWCRPEGLPVLFGRP